MLSFSDEDHDNNHLNNILKNLKNVFEDISIKKVCFDAKLIIHLCINEYIDFRIFDDISLLAYTLHTGKQKINFETLSNIYNLNYKPHDAFYICCIYKILKAQLAEERKFKIYETIEKPLLSLLVKIENKGILIDKNLLIELGTEFEQKLKFLQNEISAKCPSKSLIVSVSGFSKTKPF